MKTQTIHRLLAVLVIVAIVFFVTKPYIAPQSNNGPSDLAGDLVDALVDAGIEFAPSPTDSDLLKFRKIVIATSINAASAQRTIKRLLLLNAIDSTAPIDLYIRTDGGWIDDAFGIIDVIESINAPVNTHALGGTHSAGAMVLAAGTGVRYGYPYSSIMFHAGVEGLYDGSEKYSAEEADYNRLSQFWERHSRVPNDWVTMKEDSTFYLSPDEALEFGVVDKIKAGANRPEVKNSKL